MCLKVSLSIWGHRGRLSHIFVFLPSSVLFITLRCVNYGEKSDDSFLTSFCQAVILTPCVIIKPVGDLMLYTLYTLSNYNLLVWRSYWRIMSLISSIVWTWHTPWGEIFYWVVLTHCILTHKHSMLDRLAVCNQYYDSRYCSKSSLNIAWKNKKTVQKIQKDGWQTTENV